MPPYFLIRVNIQEQKEKKEKIGRFYTSPDHQYMIYNMEWGEVIGIGEKAHKDFPEVRVGDTLIYHHFVQNESKKKAQEKHLIHEDETYYYYTVTSSSFNGRRNETYGAVIEGEIVPHPDFVFLDVDAPKERHASSDNFEKAKMSVSAGGILLFNEWQISEDEMSDKMQKLKAEASRMAKNGMQKDGVAEAVLRKEEEMEMMSRELNKVKILPYILKYSHPSLSTILKTNLKKEELLYIESRAAATIISVKEKKFRIAPVKYIAYFKK